MLKRLVGVITVHNNWTIQSIGFKNYLTLGKTEVIAKNYDRWQLDEILVVDIDRSKSNQGPNFELLKKIASKKLSTPLSYMGGIRNAGDALNLISQGADRIAIDSLFRKNEQNAFEIADALGRQAVIRAQPVTKIKNKIYTYNHLTRKIISELNLDDFLSTRNYFSELMIIDTDNEGNFNSFNKTLLKPFKDSNLQIICFGGISSKKQISHLFTKKNISAVAIGNFLSYKEIPHKELLTQNEVDVVRMTSFGKTTKGAREW